MTTTNASPKAAALAQRRRAISTPITAMPASSEGHASAVRIQRQVGERTTGLWAEGVPFRVLSQPRRVQPSTTAEPLLMRTEGTEFTDCYKTSNRCMGHPDCSNTHCISHPDNTEASKQAEKAAAQAEEEQKAFDLRGMDYSDYHGPKTPEDRALRAWVWRTYLAGVALVVVVVASVVWK